MKKSVWSILFISLCLFSLASCVKTNPHQGQQPLIHQMKQGQIESVDLNAVFSKKKFEADDNKIGHPLVQSQSHRIIAAQIRNREKPHLHENHDLLVYLYRGIGTLKTPEHTTELMAGDWTSINRNVPHQFINRGNRPAQAIVIRMPPPEGKDYKELEALK